MKGKATTPDEARRIARVVASDLLLYNRKKIREGIIKDNLFELLEKEIDEGRRYYLSRLEESVEKPLVYFYDALIEFLLANNDDCNYAPWLKDS